MVAVTRSSTSITLKWNAIPRHQVNSLETPHYRVFLKKTNATTFTINETRHLGLTLTGLVKDTEYTIIVRAFTSFGEGPDTDIIVSTKDEGEQMGGVRT